MSASFPLPFAPIPSTAPGSRMTTEEQALFGADDVSRDVTPELPGLA